MIPAQQAVELALAAANRPGIATIVLVTDRAAASLRWAGNSMTTNGVSTSRSTAVISIARIDDGAPRVASLRTAGVDPAGIPGLVAASAEAARQAPEARDAAPLLAGGVAPADWDAPVPGTGAEVFTGLAGTLARGFTGADRLYGFARHEVETTFLASSTGLRRRHTQRTGSVEINAKRGTASAWAGLATPDFVGLPADALLEQLATRLGWAGRRVELPAGRYQTLMPPSTVADMMIYLAATMGGRGAHEGRTALAAPGGGTRVGERLTELPLTLYCDPAAAGLECAPFVVAETSTEATSVFDNGLDISRVDWIRGGVVNALAYSRADAAEFGAPAAMAADNLLMTGGATAGAGPATLDQMIAATERGLLLSTLWYIREVDPTVLLLTGLTRDGVYLIEDGRVTGAVNNFRFNESPLDLLRRASEVGVTEPTLPREWGDWATRAAMPSLRIPDFHMSSVSPAQ